MPPCMQHAPEAFIASSSSLKMCLTQGGCLASHFFAAGFLSTATVVVMLMPKTRAPNISVPNPASKDSCVMARFGAAGRRTRKCSDAVYRILAHHSVPGTEGGAGKEACPDGPDKERIVSALSSSTEVDLLLLLLRVLLLFLERLVRSSLSLLSDGIHSSMLERPAIAVCNAAELQRKAQQRTNLTRDIGLALRSHRCRSDKYLSNFSAPCTFANKLRQPNFPARF